MGVVGVRGSARGTNPFAPQTINVATHRTVIIMSRDGRVCLWFCLSVLIAIHFSTLGMASRGPDGSTFDGGESTADARLDYQVQMADIHDSFNSSQRFDVVLPGEGTVTIAASEIRISGDDKLGWTEMKPDGSSVRHESHSRQVEGTIRDRPGSHASLLLGEFGLYGIVTVPSGDGTSVWKYYFNPHETKRGEFIQLVDGSNDVTSGASTMPS